MPQAPGSSQGLIEERFAHLLQPIRDLAKNWDIDVAHFLEEYLEDLEKIEITFDDGATTMNFSEAALLIQGSAGVYAKKVEYLYSLVFQVLDLITQKKKAKGTFGEEGTDNNDDEIQDVDEQFLPLDDIPESDGSYTKEQDVTSNKSVRPVPEMPTRLIPLEESEKGDNSLYNKKGEVMGNHCDFNIDIGYISVDGSLLLELRDKALLGVTSRQPLTQVLEGVNNMHCDLDGLDVVLPMPSDVREDDHFPMEDFGGDIVDSGDAEDQGSDNVNAQKLRPQRKRVTFVNPSAKSKPKEDPWALLDPHEKSKAVEKPLKKKKPFKIPPGLSDNTTKKRKKVKVKEELPPIYEVTEKLYSHRSKFPKNPMKVPDFPELEEAFWQEFKHREEIKKEEMKEMKKQGIERLKVEEDDDDEDAGQNGAEPLLDPDDDDEEEDFIPALQLDAKVFDSHSIGMQIEVANSGNSLSHDDITLSYEDLVQRHVEKFLASAAEYAQITELSRRVSEWEEKIKPKLKEEEGHEPFDIHKYGTFVIEQLVRGVRKAFRELVVRKPEYEICRYTLATLQLANVYNLELTVIPDASGSIMDCLYVTLLSTKRHFEDLEEYRAPSLKQT